MSAISLKSITGITSITTPAGVDDQLTLHTNDTTQRVKITESGVEVAGVTTVSSTLNVSGVTNLSSELRANANIRMTNPGPKITFIDDNHNPDYEVGNLDGVFRIRDATSSVNRLAVSSTGNISILNDLDVDGHTNLDNVSVAGITTFSNGPIVPNGQYYRGIINSGSQEKIIGGYISGTDTLRLGESMYLTSTGLGIGIASPGRKIHIIPGQIKLENTSTGAWAGLEFLCSSGTNDYDAYMGVQDSDGLFFIDNNSNGIDFAINQAGQIAIGAIAPNTWSAGKAITIGTTQATLWGTGDQINLSGNAYYNSGWKAAATKAGASQIQQALGNIDFRVTGSINADAAITWTDALRITSNGNLLVNQTSEFGSAVKLSVRGASSAISDGGQIFDVTTTAAASGGTRLSFGVNEDNYTWIRSYESAVGSRDLVFSGVAEYGRFDSSGRLHIGSSNNTGSHTKLVVGAGNNVNTTAIINTGDVDTDALTLSNWDGSTTTNKVMMHFDSSGRGGWNIGMPAATDAFVIEDDGGSAALYINSSNSVIIGHSTYGAAGSFSVGANGTFRSMLASGTAQDTLIAAISGVSNGFQLTTDASNKQTYKFHSGTSQLVTITEQSDREFPTVLIGDGNNGNTYFGDYYHSGAGSRITLGTNYSGAGMVLSYNCKPAASNSTTWVSSQNAYSDKRSSLTMGGNGYKAFALYTSNTASQDAVGNTVSMDQKFAIDHNGKVELRGIGTCDNYGTGTTATHTVEDNGEVKLGNVARDQRRHSPTDFGRIKAMRSPNVLDWGLDRKNSSYQDGDGIGSFQGTYNVSYTLNGTSTQNRWVIGSGPGGGTEWLWSAVANGGRANDQGGWNISGLFLNPAYSYVFINFVKRVSSTSSGNYYMGTGGIGSLVSGAPSIISNPYWNCPGISSLPHNIWCVDYRIIHSYYYDETTPAANEGMYRMDTGAQILGQNSCGNGNGYKFADTSTGIRSYGFRSYLFYATVDSGSHLQWAQPHCYKIDGYEPKLSEVRRTHTSDNASSWTGA